MGRKKMRKQYKKTKGAVNKNIIKLFDVYIIETKV